MYRQSKRNKKGQMHSLDLIIAFSLFVLVFLSIVSFWDDARFHFGFIEQRNDIELVSRNSFNALIYTQGLPQDWNTFANISHAEEIGIMTERQGIASYEKIKSIVNNNDTHYEEIRDSIGYLGAGYEFYLNITYYDSDFNDIESDGFGFTGNCKNVVRLSDVQSIDKGGYVNIVFYGCERE